MSIGSEFLNQPIPTNPELEAAIREAKDDPGPIAVYADWLQAQGSLAGELMVLAAAVEDARKTERMEQIAEALALPDKEFATWEWRHGAWRSLRIENSSDHMDTEFDAPALARKLFATPFCVNLEELRIGVLRWEYLYDDVPAVLREATGRVWAKSLRALHLGDVSDDIDMAHHVIGDVGKIITQTFPGLVYLKMHSGEQSWATTTETFGVAGLDLPLLEELVIETCSLTSARAKAVLDAKLPKLQRLELWFGSVDRGADATLDDLNPLFEGSVLAGVRHLGLCNAEFTNDIVARLVRSPITERLESLNLSLGLLDDDGARGLAGAAARFPKLRAIEANESYLTAAGIAALEGAFPGCNVVAKNQKEIDANDPEWRYVSVAE